MPRLAILSLGRRQFPSDGAQPPRRLQHPRENLRGGSQGKGSYLGAGGGQNHDLKCIEKKHVYVVFIFLFMYYFLFKKSNY